MANTYPVYGTRTQFTCTLTSLNAGTTFGRAATAIDTTSTTQPGLTSGTRAIDFLLSGKLTTGTGPTVNNYLKLYIGTSDSFFYPGNATGTDATVTFNGEDAQLTRWLFIPVDATSGHTYEIPATSLVGLLGGFALPVRFFPVVVNDTGVNLSSTASDCQLWYQPIGLQSA